MSVCMHTHTYTLICVNLHIQVHAYIGTNILSSGRKWLLASQPVAHFAQWSSDLPLPAALCVFPLSHPSTDAARVSR